jgi:transposase
MHAKHREIVATGAVRPTTERSLDILDFAQLRLWAFQGTFRWHQRLEDDPLPMRAGFDTVMARVGAVFDAAHPRHAYLFTNCRANRLKVLVHDGVGIWLAARRLNQGQFVWPSAPSYARSRWYRTFAPR